MSKKSKKYEYDKRFKRSPSPNVIELYGGIQKKPITEDQRAKRQHISYNPYSECQQQEKGQNIVRTKDKKTTITHLINTEKPIDAVIKAVTLKDPVVNRETQSKKIKDLELKLEEEKTKNKEAEQKNLKLQEENDQVKEVYEQNKIRISSLEKKILRLETQLQEKDSFLKNIQNQYTHLIISLGQELKDDVSKKTDSKLKKSDQLLTLPPEIEKMKYKLALLTEAEDKARLSFKARIEDIDKRMKDLENDLKNLYQSKRL